LARTYWLVLNARLVILAAAAAMVLVLLVAVPAYVASTAMHPPRCSCSPSPAEYGLPYENFTARTIDGVAVSGWLIAPGNGGSVYVLLHQYSGCRSLPPVFNLSLELARRGHVVAVFDFRGHGCSGGSYTTIGIEELNDARAVVEYVARRYPGRHIYLAGFGMGASVAVVEAAGDPLVAGVAADAPYCRLGDLVDRWVRLRTRLPLGGLVLAYARLLYGVPVDPNFGPCMLGGLGKPLLVLHEELDPLVTLDEAKRVAGLSPCSRLIEVPGAGHLGAVEKLGVSGYADLLEEYFENATAVCPPGWLAGG